MNNKIIDILKGLGFVLVVGVFVWAISNMMELKNKETVEQILKDSEEKERQAQKEREKISYDNFIMAKKFDSLKNGIHSYENYMNTIKNDYSMHIQHFNTIKNEEKKFIPNATLREQYDVITNAKYSEY